MLVKGLFCLSPVPGKWLSEEEPSRLGLIVLRRCLFHSARGGKNGQSLPVTSASATLENGAAHCSSCPAQQAFPTHSQDVFCLHGWQAPGSTLLSFLLRVFFFSPSALLFVNQPLEQHLLVCQGLYPMTFPGRQATRFCFALFLLFVIVFPSLSSWRRKFIQRDSNCMNFQLLENGIIYKTCNS